MAEGIDFFPIDVEQTDWASAAQILSDIRTRVFIDEQHVPAAEEFDDRDKTAIHWIAWGENQTAMGVARLAGNRVERMAVLKPWRRRGVGSSLVRAIIAFAVREKIEQLELDAQLHAVGFYEDNGFEVSGEEFMDVGIRHVPMAMDLGRFLQQRPPSPLPDIDEELRHRNPIGNIEEFRWSALQLAKHSERQVRIFTDTLDPRVYDNDEICQAIHRLVTGHPHSRVMILVRNTEDLAKHFHRLVETFQRLSSHIELRRLNRELDTFHQEFITGDISAVLYIQNPRRSIGYLCLHSPLEAKKLNEEFDVLWNHSLPDPQIRQLHI